MIAPVLHLRSIKYRYGSYKKYQSQFYRLKTVIMSY